MQAIICTGAESSGSRLAVEIIEAGGYERDDAFISGAERIVIHRSLPHGPVMPDLAGMVNVLRGRGYNVRALVMVRNPFVVAESQVQAGHAVDTGQAFAKQEAALAFVGQQFEHCRCPFLILPYEALVANSDEVQAQLAVYLELPDSPSVEVYNGNEKYYSA